MGTPNCGTSLIPGSLTAATYTQSYTYDTLDRLQSGPVGSYTYGDAAHLHAVTSITSGGTTAYSASYDAGGNMTCRAADGTTTCAGTPTGAQLSYDNEGRLSSWQNTPTSPTTTDSFLSDGEGNRVEQQTTTNGSIVTSTVYVAGGLEESTSTGASTTLTKYFQAAGLPLVERVGTSGPLTTLASDGQGTVSEALDGSGTVMSAQLYTPYGSVRYSSGSSPTSLGYTGQRADAATGLDYYHARYYDPVAGQFASADTVQDGLNRYGYVGGNPTTATDPSGHRRVCDGDCWAPSPPPSTPPPPGPVDCHTNNTCSTPTSDCHATNSCSTTDSPDTSCDKRCQYKNDRISSLRDQAGWWKIIGTGLALVADVGRIVLHVKEGMWFKAILDGMGILGEASEFFEAIAAKIGGEWVHISAQVSSIVQKGLGILNFVRGILDTPFLGQLVQYTLLSFVDVILPGLEGPVGIGMQIVAGTLGEAALDFMSAGAHWAQGQVKSLDDEADQDQAMSLDDFCKKDGGCPA